jgi:hypothetical protein
MPTPRKYSSISQETSLAVALNSSASSMTVVDASILFAGINTIANGEYFTVVIDPDTALEEIVDVKYPSAAGNNTLTVDRGRDGSQPIAHSPSAKVRHMGIGRDFREANDHINQATGTAHGLVLTDVVEVTDTGTVSTQMLAANAVTTAKITDANVTTAKIADANVTTAKIADLNVTTGKIADSAITSAKIADGAIATGDIADAAITTAKVADGSITSAKLADGGIGTVDIADLAVTTGKVADGAITSAKIADGTIVANDIADGAITSAKILDGTIATADIADGAITSAKIADGTIANADVSGSAGIAYGKLSLGGSITSADLVDGTIVASDIADGTITQAKMAVNPYARANHTGTQSASTISDFDTQVRTNRLDQMAAPTGAVSLNSQKLTNVADPTSNQDAVTLKYLADQKGAVNGVASLDGTGKIPTGQLPSIALVDTFVVASQSAMLALTADVGDIAVRTDLNKSFILKTAGASTLANWQELLTPTDSVLSVDGNTGAVNLSGTYLAKAGGTMTGNLVLNADPSVNLGAATKQYVDAVAGSASAAAASAAAAATTYDNFDDRYLGSKSSAPTLDNDGNALITGALYWNSVSNTMFAWTGTAWGSISSTAAIYRFRFTASGGETSVSGTDANGLTLSYLPGKEQVYLNGILLVRTSDYTASNGTSITSLAALAVGDIIEIITFTAFDLATAIDKALFDAKGDILVATAADTPGKLTVGANGKFLKANSSTSTGLEWADVPNPDLSPYATITSVTTLSNKHDDDTIMAIMGAY